MIREINNTLDSALSDIYERGERLYKSGEVLIVDDNEDLGFYALEVSENDEPFYDVEVSLDPEYNDCDVYCTCNYAETGELCTHGVAALLYLKYSYLGNKPSPPSRSRALPKKEEHQQPLVIPVKSKEYLDYKTLLTPYIDNPSVHGLRVINVELEANRLLIESNLSWYDYNDDTTRTTLEWNEKKSSYLLYCDDHGHKNQCEHIELMLLFLVQFDKNLLELVRESVYQQKVMDYLKSHHVEVQKNEKLQDLVDIRLTHEKVFGFFPKGRIKGLLTADVAADFVKKAILEPMLQPDQKTSWLISKFKEPEEYVPLTAFVWFFAGDTLDHVLSISGKPDKGRNKIVSRLENVHNPFADDLPDDPGFVEAFYRKEKLNAVLDQEDETAIFKALLDFTRSAEDHHHYLSKSDRYVSSLPRKSDLTKVYLLNDVNLHYSLDRHGEFFTFRPLLQHRNGMSMEIDHKNTSVYSPALVLTSDNDLVVVGSLKEMKALWNFTHHPIIQVHHKEYESFVNGLVVPMASEFPIQIENNVIDVNKNQLKPKSKRLYISELNEFVIFRPVMQYSENREVNLLEKSMMLEAHENGVQHFVRDQSAEQAFLEEMVALHPSFKPNTQQTYFYLSYREFHKNHWFLKAFDQLKSYDVQVFGLNDLSKLKFYPHSPTISMGFKSGTDWFETELEVAFGDNVVTTRQLKRALDQGHSYIELKDGSLGVLPEEWIKKFSKLFRAGDVSKDNVRVSKTQFTMLDDLVDPGFNPEVFDEINKKKERLAHFKGISHVETPPALEAELRNYQREGLNWLNFLREYGWGGILADDMGLGKTLQALALISLEVKENPDQPNLVVAPTTLLFNWKNEIRKFSPSLDYFIHHGQRYDDPAEFGKHQVVLTSYGVVLKDVDLLRKVKFNLIIADESQAIKNLHSKRHKALTSLQGKLRIAMSGTPIENNVYELYAQMNFVNPGFYQGLTAFKQNYAQPIERSDADMVKELKNKTKPFLLRRTKEQVLTELPEKTEEYLYCEMSTGQRKVYDAFRNEYRNYLLKKFEEDGLEKSQMYVLEGLTRLRQVCDSPQLIEKEGLKETSSAKLDELTRHVTEKTGNHKILVFSQFVKMLSLVRKKFDELGIGYEYLDGKTSVKERERRVYSFQNNDECRVFLISLKAGGTGLNLTSADYVYILDPWWNPAVESQAIDRCYRMGQQKKVFAYRMICKDTVEEKIMELQQAKKSLSDDIVGESLMKSLDREDIEALFT